MCVNAGEKFINLIFTELMVPPLATFQHSLFQIRKYNPQEYALYFLTHYIYTSIFVGT